MIKAEVGSDEFEADRTWDPVGRHTAKPARLRCLEADACQGDQSLVGRIFNQGHGDKANHRKATIEALGEVIEAEGRLSRSSGLGGGAGFWVGSHGD
jgi:hypothetical protein